MIIRLNVKQETFRSNLVKMGYAYKIKQYDDFIQSIKRIVLADIKNAFLNDTMSETLQTIFNNNSKNISLDILSGKEDLQIIDSIYLSSLIEESRLDLYFEESRKITFDKNIQKLAHKKTILEDFYKNNKDSNILYRFVNHFKNSSYTENKILKCNGMNGISLSKEELIETKQELKYSLSKYICLSGGNYNKYKDIVNVLNFSEFSDDIYKEHSAEFVIDFIINRLNQSVSLLIEDIDHLNLSINPYLKIDREMYFNNHLYISELEIEKMVYSIKRGSSIEIKNMVYRDIEKLKNQKELLNGGQDVDSKIHRINKMIKKNKEFDKMIIGINKPFEIIKIYFHVFEGYTYMISDSSKLFKLLLRDKEKIENINNNGVLNEIIELSYSGKSFNTTIGEIKEYVDKKMGL